MFVTVEAEQNNYKKLVFLKKESEKAQGAQKKTWFFQPAVPL